MLLLDLYFMCYPTNAADVLRFAFHVRNVYETCHFVLNFDAKALGGWLIHGSCHTASQLNVQHHSYLSMIY